MSQVHYLPFNTRFRGTTNISQHFASHIIQKPIDEKNRRNNDHTVDLEEFIFSAVPERDNKVLAFGALDHVKQDDVGGGDDEQEKQQQHQQKKELDVNSVQLNHFRGRKLVGRTIDIAARDSSNEQKYFGLVAIVANETEAEVAARNAAALASSDLTSSNRSTVAAPSSSSFIGSGAGAATTAAVAGGISLNWKKKKTKESGVRRERENNENEEDGEEGRATEPHAMVFAAAGDDEGKKVHELKEHQQQRHSSSTSRGLINLGQIATARGVVPLEKFARFTVWDHDRTNLTALNPMIGVPLWFDIAEALHGH